MKILFITSTRIGDAVLSTGLLNHIAQEYPRAKVTIACGALAASLFEGYPLLERIIPMTKRKHAGHWRDLWRAVIGTRWDMVVDLRNSAVSRLLWPSRQYVFGKHIDRSKHKVEQCAAVMKLVDTPAPKLWFSEDQMAWAQNLIGQQTGGKILAVGPAANWQAKTWPVERFIETVVWLTGAGGLMEGARVAVFAAPLEEEAARQLLNTIPEDRRIDGIAKGSPGGVGAAISLCDFYLGNDSGLMHVAAACGVKTLGLFGPSYPEIYGPWGAHTDYVSTPESFDKLIDYEGYMPGSAPCLMETLTVEMVKKKLVQILA